MVITDAYPAFVLICSYMYITVALADVISKFLHPSLHSNRLNYSLLDCVRVEEPPHILHLFKLLKEVLSYLQLLFA